jgi:hypothetical protein
VKFDALYGLVVLQFGLPFVLLGWPIYHLLAHRFKILLHVFLSK